MNWADMLSFGEKMFPALVGFVGAWAGSRWGVTKFKREKYWEAKVKAYETVLNHFEQIAFWGRNSRAQAYCGITVGTNDLHFGLFDESMRNLSRLEVTALVYFSNEFSELIKEFRYEMETVYILGVEKLQGEPQQESFHAYADLKGNIGMMAYGALESLNQQAHEDIGMKCRWYMLLWQHLKEKINRDWVSFRKDLQ
ncbi:hypothetical protein [Citrobacter sp. Cpo015]|uniref:hypothetical protein n=1 Tax=Citrobacter sp. Cpo015 TaxID=2985121 RepID=UPI0025762F5E|nr:hypothetical protein [Citrobacter sp. Cpo015]MDM2906620.1 hypothetical protein [Citrobacter sp. Cpo015]